MDTDIYICSKPLQYFNIQNIHCEFSKARKVLIILGRFVNARLFFEQVKENNHYWDEILFFKNQFQVDIYLFLHPAKNLFVEVDNSFVYGIFSKLCRFERMYLFEEGFGSYRRDRFSTSKWGKKWINRLTGVGKHVGFSTFLVGQYLYLPDLYRRQFPDYKKQLLSFEKPFVEKLQEEMPLFLKLSNGYDDFLSVKNKRIGIYLTNHIINNVIINTLVKESDNFDLLYIKPHPHIIKTEELKQYSLTVIRSNIMMEFLLLLLLNNGNELTVFHENSTSVIWFQDRITNKNMGEHFEEYDIVASYIKEKYYNKLYKP